MKLDMQESAVRETRAAMAPDGLADGLAPSGSLGGASRRKPAGKSWLASSVLAHLPLAVAVINSDLLLLFWNEQAAMVFGAPALVAAASPELRTMLATVHGLSPQQRERLIAFCTAHVAAGDRCEPDGCLRLSLGRDRRLAVQVRGLGFGRWMVILDEGRINASVASNTDAWVDALTGLSNRRTFTDTLRDRLETGAQTAVLLIDLDRFAEVNDGFGQPVGDALLCLVAQRLQREIRDDDLLARLGGDEFVILLSVADGAEALAARVVETLAAPFRVEGHHVTIGASVGIAEALVPSDSADELMRQADLALYEAKHSGRGTWRAFDVVVAGEARNRQALEADLRRALAMGEFSVVYQPGGLLTDRTVLGFESRLHWVSCARGIVDPAVFVPLAEATGVMVELNEWALRVACVDAAGWPRDLLISAGVSLGQFRAGDRLVEAVETSLSASGLDAARLTLTIGVGVFQLQPSLVLATMQRLRALGVGIVFTHCRADELVLERLAALPFSGVIFEDAGVPAITLIEALTVAGITKFGCYLGDPVSAAAVGTASREGSLQAAFAL